MKMLEKSIDRNARLSVAPMMDWTDRHCRVLHRLISREALLYTEMVTSAALVRGGAEHLLRFDPVERPLALQLGGSDPRELAQAAALADAFEFDEINLNVGCPSDRVQSGCFGAVLMKSPDLVADCVSAMRGATRAEVTVKCRLGVDDQDPREALPRLLEAVRSAGVRRVIVHARKAWLDGLSPKENRDVPPLDYPLVAEMMRAFPDLHVSLNGGVGTLAEVRAHLDAGFDGVMVGRAAYHTPYALLGEADATLWGRVLAPPAEDIARAMIPHAAAHMAEGGRVHSVTRHMLGLFAGRPGARAWRRHLSEAASRPGAGPEIIEEALALVPPPGEVRAAE